LFRPVFRNDPCARHDATKRPALPLAIAAAVTGTEGRRGRRPAGGEERSSSTLTLPILDADAATEADRSPSRRIFPFPASDASRYKVNHLLLFLPSASSSLGAFNMLRMARDLIDLYHWYY
jgi:hypothetical protein